MSALIFLRFPFAGVSSAVTSYAAVTVASASAVVNARSIPCISSVSGSPVDVCVTVVGDLKAVVGFPASA